MPATMSSDHPLSGKKLQMDSLKQPLGLASDLTLFVYNLLEGSTVLQHTALKVIPWKNGFYTVTR